MSDARSAFIRNLLIPVVALGCGDDGDSRDTDAQTGIADSVSNSTDSLPADGALRFADIPLDPGRSVDGGVAEVDVGAVTPLCAEPDFVVYRSGDSEAEKILIAAGEPLDAFSRYFVELSEDWTDGCGPNDVSYRGQTALGGNIQFFEWMPLDCMTLGPPDNPRTDTAAFCTGVPDSVTITMYWYRTDAVIPDYVVTREYLVSARM